MKNKFHQPFKFLIFISANLFMISKLSLMHGRESKQNKLLETMV